jgi:CheY-like chemotaxis protein
MVDEEVGVRVLLVEDEIKMSRAIRRGLEQEGYGVDTALDGFAMAFSRHRQGAGAPPPQEPATSLQRLGSRWRS